MRFLVRREFETVNGKPVFRLRLRWNPVDKDEEANAVRYGLPALTRSALDVDPAPEPLLNENEWNELQKDNDVVKTFHDGRIAQRYLDALIKACKSAATYWNDARSWPSEEYHIP